MPYVNVTKLDKKEANKEALLSALKFMLDGKPVCVSPIGAVIEEPLTQFEFQEIMELTLESASKSTSMHNWVMGDIWVAAEGLFENRTQLIIEIFGEERGRAIVEMLQHLAVVCRKWPYHLRIDGKSWSFHRNNKPEDVDKNHLYRGTGETTKPKPKNMIPIYDTFKKVVGGLTVESNRVVIHDGNKIRTVGKEPLVKSLNEAWSAEYTFDASDFDTPEE